MDFQQVKRGVITFFKSGFHYWFALGIGIAFCIHQVQIQIFQGSQYEAGLSSPSNNHLRKDYTFACNWYPDFTSDCETMLISRLPLGPEKTNNKKRWLFLGDNNMKRLFERSPLRTHLVVEPSKSLSKTIPHPCWQEEEQNGLMCHQRMAQRCHLNEIFDLQYSNKWQLPNPKKFEGPLKFGFLNNYCSDSAGSESNFLDCQIRDLGLAEPHRKDPSLCGRKRLTYGGYISIEFARDVEIQTPQFTTTQENVVAYLRASWNDFGSPLLQAWGLPICVINTGLHDSFIPGIRVEDFVKNVDWYLNLFQSQCAHFIWLSSTAPNDNMEVEALVKTYDDAVKSLIRNSRNLRRMTSFINVFDSSKGWPHDNTHMDDNWYHNFGNWLVSTFMV